MGCSRNLKGGAVFKLDNGKFTVLDFMSCLKVFEEIQNRKWLGSMISLVLFLFSEVQRFQERENIYKNKDIHCSYNFINVLPRCP